MSFKINFIIFTALSFLVFFTFFKTYKFVTGAGDGDLDNPIIIDDESDNENFNLDYLEEFVTRNQRLPQKKDKDLYNWYLKQTVNSDPKKKKKINDIINLIKGDDIQTEEERSDDSDDSDESFVENSDDDSFVLTEDIYEEYKQYNDLNSDEEKEIFPDGDPAKISHTEKLKLGNVIDKWTEYSRTEAIAKYREKKKKYT